MGKIILIYLFAYLAGSVNFAIIFLKLAGKADPRLSFSGNAGTTNVYRLAGILWASVVFLLDIGRALYISEQACFFIFTNGIITKVYYLLRVNTFKIKLVELHVRFFYAGKAAGCQLKFNVS